MSQISDVRLRAAVHESESPTALLSLLALIPLAALLLVLSIGSALLFPAIALAAFYFFGKVAEARLLGGAVEVSPENFPEIADDIAAVTTQLGYGKPVRAFVVQQGEINAALWRFFGKRYIAFNSSLVSSMTRDERRFIVGRFVGALKARHLRFHEASTVINMFERLAILNVFILPYLRASVYTGDRFGTLVISESSAAFSAMDKLLIGNDLAPRVSADGIARQADRLRKSPFRVLAVLFSPHPHMTDRYLELGSFVSTASRSAYSQAA